MPKTKKAKKKKRVIRKKVVASDSQIVRDALERAFQSNVVKLYDVYLDAIVTGSDKSAAMARFKRGLKLCRQAFADTKGQS